MHFPTDLTDLFSIQYPIIQAPMAGNIVSPELVVTVSNAGGLGSIAAGYMDAETLEATILEVKSLTNNPYQVNLFVPQQSAVNDTIIHEASTRIMKIFGNQQEAPTKISPQDWQLTPLEDLISIIIEHKVPIVSFTFGTPSDEIIALLKEHKVKIIGAVTHLLEGILWQDLGADALITQGLEAGGHRATFIGNPLTVAQSTTSLLQQAKHELSLPLIAAGGIMDAKSMGAMFCMGACAVSIGTAFLTCHESKASDAHKEALLKSNEFDSVLTNEWSGAYARTVNNEGLKLLNTAKGALAPFPLQAFLIKHAALLAEKTHDPNFHALYAGTGAQYCQRLGARTLMNQWINELDQL